MGTKARLQYLIEQFLSKTITDAERAELLDYMDDPLLLAEIGEILGTAYDREEGAYEMKESDKQQLLQNIFQQGNQDASKIRTIRIWPRIAAAASIIFVLGIGGYYYFHKTSETQQTAQNKKQDIAPGGNKAYLTLANGKRITLTDAKNGMLAQQSGVSITKTANGQIIYSVSNTNHNSDAPEYNIVETPKGGQYQVKLPDGTEVWLNAASSLKYPASFASLKDRKVELTGEAYFEVAKDKLHPFIVETDRQSIKVLGTHFNVDSYSDEPLSRTTLIEGSVEVNSSTILKPGHQARVAVNKQIEVATVDVEKVIAWKNGRFMFQSESIESIMRKLARWYDVEVVYQDDVRDIPFTAFISRYDNISKILDKITYTENIHFKIEGRRVTVMK